MQIVMSAGMEMDALIAEKVMRLPVVWKEDPYREIGMPSKGRLPWLSGKAGGVEYSNAPCPRYSTDIAAAWLIVDKFFLLPQWSFDISLTHSNALWHCAFDDDSVGKRYSVRASTAPLAICLAALKALDFAL